MMFVMNMAGSDDAHSACSKEWKMGFSPAADTVRGQYRSSNQGKWRGGIVTEIRQDEMDEI